MLVQILKKRFTAEVLIIALTVAVYIQLPGNVFVDMDDQLLIINNATAHGLSWTNIKTAFTSYDPELYIPLTLLSYQIEYSLFGMHPAVIHVVSLLLHILSALLVLRIFTYFFSRNIALICALLFAVHPVDTEAVAWASGRKDVLSSLLFLVSVWQYLRWRSAGKGYAASIIAFACGLAAKVSIVPLPFALLLIDCVQGRRIDRSTLKEKLPYFLLAAVFLIIAVLGKPQTGHLGTWVLLAFVGIPFYLRAYLFPWHLSILYPFDDAVSLMHPWIAGGIALTILITVLCTFRKSRSVTFAWLWFLLLLVPAFPTVIKGGGDNVTQLYYASDRYVYLAGLGLLYLLGALLTKKNSSTWYKVAAAVVAIASLLTYKQVLVWRDSESLYQNVLVQGRQSHVAHLSLARLAGERGDLDEALRLYQESNAIQETSKALLNIGQIYALQGDNQKAIETYQSVLQKWPELADVHEHIGRLYLQQGVLTEALSYFQRSIELEPTYVPAYFNIGILFELAGDKEGAIEAFKRVLELHPGDKQAEEKLREYGVSG